MSEFALRLYLAAQRFHESVREESGQDLVEYALVVALLSFAAIASMTNVATKIGTSFTNIATKFGSYTS